MLTKSDIKVYELLKENNRIKQITISDKLKICLSTVKRAINKLEQHEFIKVERHKAKINTYQVLKGVSSEFK